MTSPGHRVRHEQTGVARLMETRKESEYPQAQALPVALGTPDLQGSPTSAEEYLAFVRHEAAQCPAVVRVAIDNKKTNKSMSWPAAAVSFRDDSPLPQCLRPSEPWIFSFVSDFSKVRRAIEVRRSDGVSNAEKELPCNGDIHAWDLFALGNSCHPEGKDGGRPPKLSHLLYLDQVTISALLDRFIELLEGETLPTYLTVWIFSLAASLEKPLSADMEASLRRLLRQAEKLVAGLDTSDVKDAAQANILIVMAGGYFGQDLDLRKVAGACLEP